MYCRRAVSFKLLCYWAPTYPFQSRFIFPKGRNLYEVYFYSMFRTFAVNITLGAPISIGIRSSTWTKCSFWTLCFPYLQGSLHFLFLQAFHQNIEGRYSLSMPIRCTWSHCDYCRETRDLHTPFFARLYPTCVLLSDYQTTRPTTQSWILIGMCCRIAFDLGLNRLDEDNVSALNAPQWSSETEWSRREEQRRAGGLSGITYLLGHDSGTPLCN